MTVLHLATKKGLLDIVKCLIEGGADIEAKNGEKQTALHLAAKVGHFEVGKFLIDSRANLNSLDSLNRTPLHLAVKYGHIQMVINLLNDSANINSFDCFNKTPLHYACLEGQLDIVQLLIRKGACIQPKISMKFRASNCCTILSQFASLNVQENSGDLKFRSLMQKMSPLDLAAQNGHLNVVKFLVQSGAQNISLKHRFDIQDNDVYHYLDYVQR
jgi:ankyrin repeat protein